MKSVEKQMCLASEKCCENCGWYLLLRPKKISKTISGRTIVHPEYCFKVQRATVIRDGLRVPCSHWNERDVEAETVLNKSW